jgi:hypothetical protein
MAYAVRHWFPTTEGFAVDEVVLEWVFSEFLRFSLLIIDPKLPHFRLSYLPEVCNNGDQAAHYHILCFKF